LPTPRPIEERALHAWLRRTVGRAGPLSRLPMGDDVAALRLPRGTLLLTTDAFSEGTHFVTRSPPEAIGAALVAANLSDLASKGGRPVAFLVDLLVPPGTEARWAEGVLRGVRRALRPYGLDLAGGDTKPARGRSVVGTAVGIAPPGSLPGRHRARPGDVLAVTGRVGRGGWAAREFARRGPEDLRAAREILSFSARIAEGERLAPKVRAMMDTSDGLFESAHLLSAASGVRVLLEPDRLPLDRRIVRAEPDPKRRLAVAGFGGDYELFASLAPARFPAAQRALRSLGSPLTLVGRVEKGSGAWFAAGPSRRPIPRGGWDPFRPAPP
jgi:thiamine-monophosphate kinase